MVHRRKKSASTEIARQSFLKFRSQITGEYYNKRNDSTTRIIPQMRKIDEVYKISIRTRYKQLEFYYSIDTNNVVYTRGYWEDNVKFQYGSEGCYPSFSTVEEAAEDCKKCLSRCYGYERIR